MIVNVLVFMLSDRVQIRSYRIDSTMKNVIIFVVCSRQQAKIRRHKNENFCVSEMVHNSICYLFIIIDEWAQFEHLSAGGVAFKPSCPCTRGHTLSILSYNLEAKCYTNL